MLRRTSLPAARRAAFAATGTLLNTAPGDFDDRLRNINDQFAEARELINDAFESIGSNYYSDDAEDAKMAVAATLDMYRSLLSDEAYPQEARTKVDREYGMKMKQLEGELEKVLDHD